MMWIWKLVTAVVPIAFVLASLSPESVSQPNTEETEPTLPEQLSGFEYVSDRRTLPVMPATESAFSGSFKANSEFIFTFSDDRPIPSPILQGNWRAEPLADGTIRLELQWGK